jgi:Fe(3+) dicitrate transport protein
MDYKKIYLPAIAGLMGLQAGAQSIGGRVLCNDCDATAIRVYCNNEKVPVAANGTFRVTGMEPGNHQLRITAPGFSTVHKTVKVGQGETAVDVQLHKLRRELKEVEVAEKQEGNFSHMYNVDGMKLAAGKKTEVINTELLTVNKATNNTRQVFGKVAGLNIFENDGSGLQLSIGGRGLDPNRTANFNVRQNGYDISADALGYPESYYTPPTEALRKIQVIKGAASLQFGTQFGGLLNFEMKQPVTDRKISVESRQTVGSWGFFNSFNSVSGTVGKTSYLAYVQYKRGNGWRPNSGYEALNAYADVHYQVSDRHRIGLQYTFLTYLAQQPGGLDDRMFATDPLQSNRARNWFKVNWNLLSLDWDYRISDRTRLETKVFGLMASREALGFRPNRPSQVDNGGPRDLLTGTFTNATLESRLLHRYQWLGQQQVLLTGIRVYNGYSTNKQGWGSKGSDADFTFHDEANNLISSYNFPNVNVAAFAEHIFQLTDKFSVTPGLRAEYILTRSNGYYHDRVYDLRDSIVSDKLVNEHKELPRAFVLGGIGFSYKAGRKLEWYANLSQNYRSITFSDIRVVNPSFEIDSNIADERGWSADFGFRGQLGKVLSYDINGFYLYYGNRIGEYYTVKNVTQVIRKRGNVGVAQIAGMESLLELQVLRLFPSIPETWNLNAFSNLSLTHSQYTKSAIKGIEGKQVEYVPTVNWKTGLQAAYRSLKVAAQFSYLSAQYADATNAEDGGYSAVNGLIPAYRLIDLSAGYQWRWLIAEASVNNVANVAYFTRRAAGYPGPGIIPGDGRSFFLTLGVKF